MPMPSRLTWRLPVTQMLKINPVGMFSRPVIPSTLSRILLSFSLWTLLLNSWIQFLPFIFISRLINTFPFISLPKSSGYRDRTIVFVSFRFLEVARLWRRNIDFTYIGFVWMGINCWTIYLIMLINVYCVAFYIVFSFSCMYIFLMVFVGKLILS